MEARDWDRAAACLSPDITVWWPATDERFVGDAFLSMQQAFPEGWRIEVVDLLAEGARVASRIVVHMDGQRFWSHGWWRVSDGRIAQGVELWTTEGEDSPPDWRHRFTSDGQRDAPRPTGQTT